MTDLQKHIAELQTKAAEIELIAGLSTDAKAKTYTERLSEEHQKANYSARHRTGCSCCSKQG